jgi:hypothetical protein
MDQRALIAMYWFFHFTIWRSSKWGKSKTKRIICNCQREIKWADKNYIIEVTIRMLIF